MKVADPIDLRTPQMTCPKCRKPVRITRKGTIAQHTRDVYRVSMTRRGPRHTSTDKRCPASFTGAPDGAHATWLRSRYAEAQKVAEHHRALADEARKQAEAHDAEALVHANRAADASAALASIGATP